MGDVCVDFKSYTEDEKVKIYRVLLRDEILRNKDQLRIMRLKGDLDGVRRKGAICTLSGAGGGSRSCGRCRGELGRIINRGANCPVCRQRVCKSCREYGRPNPTQWLCTLCHKHMELTAASGEWMKGFVRRPGKGKDNGINATETIKRSLQRSWTFSDTSPSPWSYLRGSPEMRAYSSMPRHQDCDFLPTTVFSQVQETNELNKSDTEESKSKDSNDYQTNTVDTETENLCDLDQKTTGTGSSTTSDMEFPGTSEVSSVESSPLVDKSSVKDVVEPLTGTIFRRVTLKNRRVDARNLPAGVTPPRSRRHLRGNAPLKEEPFGDGLHLFLESSKALIPDSEDYKLVFISSDSSSREELQSDDGSSSSSSLLPPSHLEDCDWDYFEYCYPAKPEKKEWPWVRAAEEGCARSTGGSTVAADRPIQDSCRADFGVCSSCPLPFHLPIPVPVPVPVPVFVPVPWNPNLIVQYPFRNFFLKDGAMTTGLQFDSSRFGVPNSEILPVDELLCNKAVSSVLVSDKSEQEEDGVVLKLYKTLDTTDCASVSAPEDILRLTEDRLKDFTDLRDDASVSSTSSEDEENPKVPSTRIYRLARDSSDEEDSSEDFSLAATPPRSLTSSSESSNEDSSEGGKPSKFKKTYVINDSDSEKGGLESDYEEKYDTVTVEESSPLDKDSHKTDLEINKEEPDISEVRVDCSSSIDLRIVSSDVKSREATPEADTGQDVQDFDISCQSDSELNSDSELSNTVIITSLVSSEHQDETESEVHFQQNVENFDSISQTSITEKSATESVIVREHTDSISSDSCASTTELVQDVISEANDPKLSPTSDLVSEVQDDKPNIEAKNNVHNNNHSNSDVIDSIITYSYVEILQVLSEFLNAERCLYEVSERAVKNCKAVEVEVGPETRSNTSDEFSGTESMEMPLEDSLECGGEAGQVRPGGELSGTVVGESWKETGRYTSLVMITQELGGPEEPPSSPPQEHNDEVTVVTGANTLSAVVCLEEGLADDDSWVEELDRDEIATTTEESSEEEIFPDREEELRGFHKTSIDFTLHTIVEESCEESEVEVERTHPTELEKYFVYGIGESLGDEERETDTLSETSSIYSEGVESVGGAEQQSDNNGDPADLASSRLEKYFLNGFKDFRPRDSDGSVGSDSEGKPSPEQRRKRLVRARGTARQHSNSLDNLTESEQQLEVQLESEDSSTETDSHDDQSNSFEKNDGQFDTVKRTKKKKRSVSSAPSMELLETPEDCISGSKEDLNSDEGKKTPQPEYLFSTDLVSARNKQQSRDSGFVGSCDDLLKDSRESPGTEVSKTEDESNIKIEPAKIVPELTVSSPPATALTRKDSFNNWSSDEETNLMMSKMRAFFKTMVGSQCKGSSPNVKPKTKPPQLLYFETELTRLMKTVPGLKDEQVKEIVEYLSSEDTWSDSYDSSDYTSSDLESGNKKSALQEEISASCRQIISNFESSNVVDEPLLRNGAENKDSVYQRIVASFSKIETPAANSSAPQNSPPLMEKVMQHIGTRLVALMHEVSSGEGASPRVSKHHRRLQSKLSATSTTEEEEDSTEDFSPLPRSKSHDPLLEENKQEASDNERFSWRGSFESALMASDSRTRLASGGEGSASALALAAKRRSAGDLMFKSREELDRVRSWGSMVSGSAEDKIWSQQRAQRRRRRSSESGGSADGDDDSEEEEAGETGGRATLPRLQPSSVGAATNSLPRLPTSPPAPTIYKAHSVNNVKSARYRPPGYRNSGGALAPRRDQRRRPTPSPAQPLSHPHGCDDTSVCSEPVGRGQEEEVDRLRTSLGARSDSLASVYSGAGEGRHGGVTVKGEVQFNLQYNYKQSSLEIHVKQCRDLAPVDLKRNRSDPYVKVYLLPDKSKSGKRKTRVKKHTLNPVFEETLRFQVSLDGLENRTLWLSVWHSDMFGRNDFLGEVLMPLENKVFDDPLPKFYTLQERSEPLEELNPKGELIVGLKFVPPEGGNGNKKRPSKGRLLVLVKEAKNLPAVKSNGTSDPFCKSYLLPDKGRGSKQKAPVLRRTCNPAWNHTFTYNNISIQDLSERSLELTIWDHDRLASNEFLGGVRLNLGSGKHSGKVVDWMDSSGNEVTLWQRMVERPNFWVESCLPLRPSLDVRRN